MTPLPEDDRKNSTPRIDLAEVSRGCQLGRTSNFYMTFPELDGSVSDYAQYTRDTMGVSWDAFVAERPELYEPALEAVHALLQKRSEMTSVEEVVQMMRSGQAAEAEEIAVREGKVIAEYHERMREKIESCFDELVRRGANPDLLAR